MALTLGDNFSYQGAKPLDARLKYDTLAAMKAVADATMYDGCMAYCSATDKTYQWKSTNTVDETLGKWREFESGGGVTDYTDLDNKPSINDVELSGNKTPSDLGLASSADAYNINDTKITGADLADQDLFPLYDVSESDKKNIRWQHIVGVLTGLYQGIDDKMTTSDMDEIFSTLPSIQKSGHNYSTAEHVVGTWIDGSTIYEKTINFGALPNTNTKQVAHNISNLKRVVNLWGHAYSSEATSQFTLPYNAIDTQYSISVSYTAAYITVITGSDRAKFTESYITIQYTKS